MKILLTGFDAFGGEKINPANEAVSLLRGKPNVECITVPTVYNKSVRVVTEKIEEMKPEAVVLVGQAGGRACITPERVAVNRMKAFLCDNEGNNLVGKIYENGPDELFSTLPNDELVRSIIARGIPAEISDSAGTFVCNHLLYGTLLYLKEKFPGTMCGFIHVPYIPQQVVSKPRTPSMSLETTVGALEAVVDHLNSYNNIK